MYFYRSTSGTDGKVAGQWYPFFGEGRYNTGGDWLIKGNLEDVKNGHYIPQIQEVQAQLNAKFPIVYDKEGHLIKNTWKFGSNSLFDIIMPGISEYGVPLINIKQYPHIIKDKNSRSFIESILNQYK